ncbi:hypothetical protein B0T17DRAFT_490104 [Bombardia bombarda]|uniref:Uncharacterized protein n=1 Tax=Bombardia bombarda TaxID=252184 RepID=A0AA40CAF7_9PEZI|nr:hypothetical protein B0T17DRAFT_490104 [Bombardia bombarda]
MPLTDTDNHASKLQTILGGEKDDGIEAIWIPLYGYQGIVWFQLNSLNTFVDAVDRLLCLDNRAGVKYTLYIFDKDKSYKTKPEQERFLRNQTKTKNISCGGVGDYSRDHVAWEWIINRLGYLGKDESTELHKAHTDKVLFVTGPGDLVPWGEWEPKSDHRVLKIMLEWDTLLNMNRPDVAYLRLPVNVMDDVNYIRDYTNEFAPWMQRVCRVLTPGRIPNRPGQPSVPDVLFGLKNDKSSICSYGGLLYLPRLWRLALKSWEAHPKQPVVLVAKSPTDVLSDRFHIFIPGHGRTYDKSGFILHRDFDNINLIRSKVLTLVSDSMDEDSFADLESIEVHLPGTGFFVLSDDKTGINVPMSGTREQRDAVFYKLQERLKNWKDWMEIEKKPVPPANHGLNMFPQFITLRPTFPKYTINVPDRPGGALEWYPDLTGLDQLRTLVAELWKTTDISNSWIVLSQEHNANGNKPKLLVGPETSETEWLELRKLIIQPNVIVAVDVTSGPVFGDFETEQPFGYHDIYAKEAAVLYGQQLSEYPSLKRYHDYQLWDEDATADLKTIQPWEDQPGVRPAFSSETRSPVKDSFHSPMVHAAAASAVSNLHNLRPTYAPSYPNTSSEEPLRVLSTLEKGLMMRAFSYDNPLDVQMDKSIPTNAPPIDMLLNLGYDSLPVISLGVLTPTEQRRMQRGYAQMRNVILNRSQRCPYAGCSAIFPVQKPQELQQHLVDAHTAEKCNFCDERLFSHWTAEQRYEHYALKHSRILEDLLPAPQDNAVSTMADDKAGFIREFDWRFCSRCGRDHDVLNMIADRKFHDSVCYPPRTGDGKDVRAAWEICSTCGDHKEPGKTHKHRVPPAGTAPFCTRCAVPLGDFTRSYREKHEHFCQGYGRKDPAKHCPWCGIEQLLIFDERTMHISNCAKRPSLEAQGPIDVEKGRYFGGKRGTGNKRFTAEGNARKNPVFMQSDRVVKAAAIVSKSPKSPGKVKETEPAPAPAPAPTPKPAAPTTAEAPKT